MKLYPLRMIYEIFGLSNQIMKVKVNPASTLMSSTYIALVTLVSGLHIILTSKIQCRFIRHSQIGTCSSHTRLSKQFPHRIHILRSVIDDRTLGLSD